MTTPLNSAKRLPASIFLAGCALLTAASYVAQAANTPAGPSVIISTVEKSVGGFQHQTSGSSSAGGSGANKGMSKGGFGGGSGGGSKSDTSSSTLTYTITVRNLTATPVKGLQVEWHVYNKTATHNGNNSSTTVDDITGTETVDLDGNGKAEVVTSDIPHVVSNSTSGSSSSSSNAGGYGKKTGGTKAPAVQNSSITSVMGTYVVLKYDGKTLGRPKADPDDVQDQVKAIQKRNGG